MRAELLETRPKTVLDQNALVAGAEAPAGTGVDVDDQFIVRLEVRRQVGRERFAPCLRGHGDANERREGREIWAKHLALAQSARRVLETRHGTEFHTRVAQAEAAEVGL